MAFSEEIKLEAFSLPGVRCKELVIYYKERYGESKLNIWRDGFANFLFIFKNALGAGQGRTIDCSRNPTVSKPCPPRRAN